MANIATKTNIQNYYLMIIKHLRYFFKIYHFAKMRKKGGKAIFCHSFKHCLSI